MLTSNNPTMADIFPSETSRQLEGFDQRTNLHELEPRDAAVAGEQPASAEAASESFPGLVECHVEMLVSVLNSDDGDAWHNLRQAMRNSGSGIGCTNMGVRHNLASLLKEHFRRAAERRQQHHDRRRSTNLVNIRGSYSSNNRHNFSAGWSNGVETHGANFISDESWNEISEDSGEFLMGGRKGQGLQPISYKDVDLLQHPRSDLFGGCRTSISGAHARRVVEFV